MIADRAVFLDLDTVDRDDLDLGPLTDSFANWQWYRGTMPDQLSRHTSGARILVSNKVVLDEDTLQKAEGLKLICIAATGTNNVDLDVAQRLGIPVTNVMGYATDSVVQHVFSLILSLTTRQNDYQGSVREGAWSDSPQFCLLDFPIRELAGKTLGIIGYGELGRAVARVGEAFGMKVLISQRPGGVVEAGRAALSDVLAQSDVLTLHCPLADNTRNLIAEAELRQMKTDALLINTARGGIVDEFALAAALREGVIGGAGIDVLSVEPPPTDNPLLSPDIPNLILTPHIAWASRESRQRLIIEVAKNIQAYLDGEWRNRVV